MAAIRRRDRETEWWVDFRHRGRRIRKRSPVQSRRGADDFERSLRVELEASRATGRDPFAEVPRLRDFAPRWMTQHAIPSNRRSSWRKKEAALRVHLLPLFGMLRLDEITVERIDAFKAEKRAEGLSPKTVNNYLSMLRGCLGKAVDWGLLAQIPRFRWLKVPNTGYRFLSEDESRRLVAAARTGYWRTLILFLLHTGCRFGEAAAVRWEDIELDAPVPVAHIRFTVSDGELSATKGNAARDVPLSAELVGALHEFHHDRRHVFELQSGRFARPESAANYLHRICKRAGVRKTSWHPLRHTFATTLTSRGVPIQVLQPLLGHQDIKTTARYAHVASTVLPAAIARLPSLLGNEAPSADPFGHQMVTNAGRGKNWSPTWAESTPESPL